MYWPAHNTVNKIQTAKHKYNVTLGTFVKVISNSVRIKIMSAILKSVQMRKMDAYDCED